MKGTKLSRAKKALDRELSVYIRARDKGKPCIDLCEREGTKQAGHFRRRELMSTRYNPKNMNGQNEYCNSWDNDTYRHGKGIDERWGKGTAEELDKISRKTKQWTLEEIQRLRTALKNGTYEFEYAKMKV